MFIYRLLVAVPFVLFIFIPLAHAERIETHSGGTVYVHSSAQSGGSVTSVTSQGSTVHTSTESGSASVHLRTVINGETVLEVHETSEHGPLSIETRSIATSTYATTTIHTTLQTPVYEYVHTVKSPPPMAPVSEHFDTRFIPLPELPTTSRVTAEHISSTVTNGAGEQLHTVPTEHTLMFSWPFMFSSFTHTYAYVLSLLFP